MKKWMLAILVVIIILLVLPWFMGRTAEQQFLNTIGDWNASHAGSRAHIQVETYRRGWFHSSATLSIAFENLGYQKSSVAMTAEIAHGPLIFSAGHIFNLAYVTGEVVLPDWLPGEAIEYQATLSYRGQLALEWLVPPVDVNQQLAEIHWEGMQGSIHYNTKIHRVAAKTEIKAFNVLFRQQWQVTSSPITLVWQANKALGLPFYTGTLQVNFPFIKGWIIASMSSDKRPAIRVPMWNLDQLMMTKTDGLENNLYSSSWELNFSELSVLGYRVGPAVLKMTAQDFSATGLAKLFEFAHSISRVSMSVDLQEVQRLLPSVLTPQSVLSVTEFSLPTPEGEIKATAKITWPTKMTSLSDMIARANVTAFLNIPKWIALRLLERETRSEQAQWIVDGMIQRGYVTEKQGELSTDFHYASGIPYMNGKVVEVLPPMPGPVMSPKQSTQGTAHDSAT